ncbi:hypothetical protein [Bacillus subtilis]|uniref:hypothetical protein n=1 Tax=Bacillus subtilis TaxID=1423 RepID=UPI0011A1F19A|nr:hypothetical protein [Bacillus subtilis]
MKRHFGIKAYKEGLEEMGEGFGEEWVVEKGIRMNDGKGVFDKWNRWKEKGGGIFVGNEEV